MQLPMFSHSQITFTPEVIAATKSLYDCYQTTSEIQLPKCSHSQTASTPKVIADQILTFLLSKLLQFHIHVHAYVFMRECVTGQQWKLKSLGIKNQRHNDAT